MMGRPCPPASHSHKDRCFVMVALGRSLAVERSSSVGISDDVIAYGRLTDAHGSFFFDNELSPRESEAESKATQNDVHG